MTPDLASKLDALFRTYLVPLAWHVLGAVAVWIVGGWVINLIRTGFHRALRIRRVDATLCRYLDASANVVLQRPASRWARRGRGCSRTSPPGCSC